MAMSGQVPSGLERHLDHLQGLEFVAREDARTRIMRALSVAREVLGMETAYLTRFTATHQEVLEVSGESSLVKFERGCSMPLERTYCRRMLEGEIPNLIRDTSKQPEVLDLSGALGINAYAAVPLELSDGRIYGTLCCLDHRPRPELDDRDALFLRVLARVAGDALEVAEVLEYPTAKPVERDDARARLSLWFAGAPRAAQAARLALQSLNDELAAEILWMTSLLVTELVTNSVRHAGIDATSAVGLDVVVGPTRVKATVSDPGPGFEPNPEMPQPDAEGGRGVPLIDSLAQDWGVESAQGTSVWFELSTT